MDDSGAGQTRLTSAFGTVAEPTFSRFGRLTYSGLVDGHWEIVSGGNTSTELITRDEARNRQPRWIGESTLIYVSDRSGNEDIWRLVLGIRPRLNLTPNSEGRDVDPAPSPDGKRLAFASSPVGSGDAFDIYVLTFATKQVAKLTDDGAGNRRPSWSPDGKRLVFDRPGNGGSDIWVMDANGTDAHPVLASSSDEFGASYAPAPINGRSRFAYVTNKNGNYEVWTVNDDGSNAYDLSQSPGGDDFAPFWAPAPPSDTAKPWLLLTPTEVQGAGGGPNTTVECTVHFEGEQPIVGTPYSDVICGTNGRDKIAGKGGNDRIYPRGGRDAVFGGAGDDYIYARGGKSDVIRGNGGIDIAWVDDSDDPKDNVETTVP
jgi:dipeptidyl aminopeptidase/acylaminoacyl peptidase